MDIRKLIKEITVEELNKVYEYDGVDEAAFHRAHYKHIADILRRSKTVPEVAQGLISIFKSDNPLFDESKFLAAAGMPPAPTQEPQI